MARKLAPDPRTARAIIMEGRVLNQSRILDKPGMLVDKNTRIRVRQKLDYVSRGALKLKSAFLKFELRARGMQAIDVGSSTGGFTDYLLGESVSKVTAIDVSYGQLSWKLRQDKRVTVIERTNIRNLDVKKLAYLGDLTVVDVSFISLKLIFNKLLEITKPGGFLLLLLKPQFEIQKELVPAGGIIADQGLHRKVIMEFLKYIENFNVKLKGITFSRIKGAKGNIEYWIYLEKSMKAREINSNYDKMVEDVIREANFYFDENR